MRASSSQHTQVCLSVIVPVYNEIASVDRLLAAVRAVAISKEIIIVDDGSSDGTRDRLRALSNVEDLTVLFHRTNVGKGAAIRTALRYATGTYVVIQDADLEYDPRDYTALLRPLQEGRANVVYGVRTDSSRRGVAFFLGARLLTALTNVLYFVHIHDEASCYKAFRRSLLNTIPLECTRFEFCPEITAKLCRMHQRIVEVPIQYRPRTARDGKKLTIRDGWTAIWTLCRWRIATQKRLSTSRAGSLDIDLCE